MTIYDLIIIVLGTATIAAAFYYSNKIFHSTVRHVGMVRSAPGTMPRVPDDESVKADALGRAIERFYLDPVTPPDVESHLLEQAIFEQLVVEGFRKHRRKKTWRCDKCGLVQTCGKDLRCRRCASSYAEKIGESLSEAANDVSLEEQVRLHSKMLDKHFEMFASLEEKVRQLETESLRKAQEIEHEASGRALQSFEN